MYMYICIVVLGVMFRDEGQSFANLSLNSSSSQESVSSDRSYGVIEDQIVDYLSKAPGQTAPTLAISKHIGGSSKKHVNKFLYNMEKLNVVEKVKDVPPLWRLKNIGKT